MRSLKTSLAVAAVLSAGFMTVPAAAHAATAPKAASSATCQAAIAAANKAEAALDAAVADAKKQVAAGGHLGMAEEDNIEALKNAAALATSDAVRACGVTPVGPVRTGVGSTSQGADSLEIAAGLGLVGAVGAGAVALRRRRVGGEA